MAFFRCLFLLMFPIASFSQLKWQNVDSLYGPLPKSVHVYFTDQSLDTGKFRAFYVIADLKDKKLEFTTDTTHKRRFTPSEFWEKNNQPLVVVNGTFFSFETNQNLNAVIRDGKLISYNPKEKGRGKDSLKYFDSYKSAIGISKKRRADVAWVKTDSTESFAKASQLPVNGEGNFWVAKKADQSTTVSNDHLTSKWKMQTAIGGGPVLLQDGEIKITNDIERKFTGKAINDKHPRTAMGYTSDNKLIILMVEGRNPNASGATLPQLAQILKALGCVEALNLDGGGSSCLLVNGKETIKPSDKGGQRAVPAVFIIKGK
jgi:exopolysaccharide biosynthesis protein